MATVLRVEGVMTPHIYWDGEGAKLNEINATGRTNPSQHVYGHENVLRQLAVARECSAAWLTRLDTTAVIPVCTSIPSNSWAETRRRRDSAKLTNGWGPVANQKVTFSVGKNGAACTATTNAEGVASCAVRPLRPHKDELTASFAGAQDANFVDLPAETTAQVCSNGNCKDK